MGDEYYEGLGRRDSICSPAEMSPPTYLPLSPPLPPAFIFLCSDCELHLGQLYFSILGVIIGG